jgi:drug/metabolite transporter (DMT)-like permease
MSKRTAAVLALILTVTIWGTTFAATKFALRDMQPLTLSLVRFVIASLLLLPLAVADHRRRGGAVAWRGLAVAGFFGGFLYFALQNVGLALTSATKTALILGGVPALTALLSIVALKERVTLGRAAGIAGSVLGVAVIVLSERGANLSEGGLLGDVLIAGCGLSWAIYTIQVKGLEGSASPVALAAASVGFGALYLLPFVGVEVAMSPPAMPSSVGWLAIAYLSLVASAAPFFLWNFALSVVDASEAAVYINLVPLIAVASAVLTLGESVAPAHLAGGVLVLLGVWAAGLTPATRRAPDSSGAG